MEVNDHSIGLNFLIFMGSHGCNIGPGPQRVSVRGNYCFVMDPLLAEMRHSRQAGVRVNNVASVYTVYRVSGLISIKARNTNCPWTDPAHSGPAWGRCAGGCQARCWGEIRRVCKIGFHSTCRHCRTFDYPLYCVVR